VHQHAAQVLENHLKDQKDATGLTMLDVEVKADECNNETVLRPIAYLAIALIGVQRYGSGDDLENAERVNTSIDSRSLYCLLDGWVLHLVVLSLLRYASILHATV
jgi:hypothetical protein